MWGKALTVAVCPDAMMQGTLCRRGGRQGTPEGERNHGGSLCLRDICSQGRESLDQRVPKSNSSSGAGAYVLLTVVWDEVLQGGQNRLALNS